MVLWFVEELSIVVLALYDLVDCCIVEPLDSLTLFPETELKVRVCSFVDT